VSEAAVRTLAVRRRAAERPVLLARVMRRQLVRRLLVLGSFLVLACIAHVWLRLQVIKLGYDLSDGDFKVAINTLLILLVAFQLALTAAGVLAQVILGYHDFEPGLYLKVMFGLQLPEYLLFSVLALVLHGLVNQKYIGHLVVVVAYVLIALAPP